MIHKIINIHLKVNKKKFIINWYYNEEDEDILDTGTLFSSNSFVPFNFIMIEN